MDVRSFLFEQSDIPSISNNDGTDLDSDDCGLKRNGEGIQRVSVSSDLGSWLGGENNEDLKEYARNDDQITAGVKYFFVLFLTLKRPANCWTFSSKSP